MVLRTEAARTGAVSMEVRDGRGHLVEEGHVLPPRAGGGCRVVLGDRVVSVPVLRELIEGELALLACAEDLDRWHA